MEFLEEPTGIFHAASQNSCSGTLLGVLAPKRSWLGKTYRYFHRRHGICIELFDRLRLFAWGPLKEILSLSLLLVFIDISSLRSIKQYED